MAFQFMCPQGHVLQGDESLAGQTIQCPQCSTSFIVPSADATSEAVPPQPPAPQDSVEGDDLGIASIGRGRRSARFAFLDEDEDTTGQTPEVINVGPKTSFDPTGDPASDRMVSVPCPNGHVLNTPYSTMGEEVLCPHCGSMFVLSYTNSLEYHRDVEMKQDVRDRQLGKKWFTWAILAACGVGVLIIALIISANM